MIDRTMMLCARDIELMCNKGIPYHKALRHMQYLLAPYEVRAAREELRKLAEKKRLLYRDYKNNKGA